MKVRHNQVTCHCPAYSFPHRHGSGKCSGAYAICTSCGEACEEVPVDFGYGPYEYGSERGIHTDVQLFSKCCEAEIYKVKA